MTTIKSYTDIEQSRKLAEILPLESADMCYVQDLLAGCKYGEYKPYIGDLIPAYGQDKIRCWSIAALLNVLPKGYSIGRRTNGKYYVCMTHITHNISEFDNPVDACVEMIITLSELKKL